MLNINKLSVGGRLAFDPELKSTKLGANYCEISVATERNLKDGDKWKKETTFIRVTLWGKNAENVCNYLSKGSQIYIEGRIKTDQWEKDGRKQSRMVVIGESVQFVGSGEKKEHVRKQAMPQEYNGQAPDFGCDDEIPF